LAWPAACAVGVLATAVLVVNNVRDRRTDEQAGKRTLAVRFGRRAACVEYALLLVVAYAAPLAAANLAGSPWVLLPLASAPLAMRLAKRVFTMDGRALNRALASTAQLLLLHAGLFAAGLVLASRRG